MSVENEVILLVEDNEDDVFIFRRAYKQAGLPYPLQVAGDGQEALDYLQGMDRFADRTAYPLPFLVLLDLKLPFKNGLEVLQIVRHRPELAGLCVVVLTSSAEQRDLVRARELGAHAYLVKPPAPSVLVAAIESVRQRHEGKTPGAARPIQGNLLAGGSNPPV